MPSITGQRQEDHSKFEANLVCVASSTLIRLISKTLPRGGLEGEEAYSMDQVGGYFPDHLVHVANTQDPQP